MKNKSTLLRIAEILIAVLIGLVAAKAHAATITVDTADQCDQFPCTSDDGQTGCSFGEAIVAINDGHDVGDCKSPSSEAYGTNDVINLPAAGVLEFSRSDHPDPVGPTALPTITRSVTIHGHGATLKRASLKRRLELVMRPMRFFEIASLLDEYNSGFGSEILVFWDQTTFDGGNPGCTTFSTDFVEKVAYLERYDVIKADFDIKESFDIFSDQHDNFPFDYYERTCHSGGAGYVRGSGAFVSFNEATFKDNQVDLHWPYYSPLGGAVFIEGGAFTMANFNKSLFTGNKAPAGGAIYAGVGVQLSLTESTFADNAARVLTFDDQPETQPTADNKMGGAVYSEGPSLVVNNSAFLRNQGGVAGALAIRGKSASILNSTFFDNFAEFSGGAVAMVPIPFNYRDLHGPAIPNTDSSGFNQYAQDTFSRFGTFPNAHLEHVTIVGNSAGDGPETRPAVSAGGGIANLGAGAVTLKSLILANNAVFPGGSGPNCYGAFLSYGTNDVFGASDGSCGIISASGSPADLSIDPVLKACNPDTADPGEASCDPETTSPILEAALSCPPEDQHHVVRDPAKCTVGAIEVEKPAVVLAGTSCGNGQVEEGEQCDESEVSNSNEPDATCRTDCTARRCGDGIVDTEAGEQCEPELDAINCRSDCTIDLCFQVKGDAIRVGAGDLKLSDYLAKYGINPTTGCSPNPEINQCQPLSSLGGPGSDHADFTVPNTVCLTTSNGGCSLITGNRFAPPPRPLRNRAK